MQVLPVDKLDHSVLVVCSVISVLLHESLQVQSLGMPITRCGQCHNIMGCSQCIPYEYVH